jgi:4-hydroxy-2-oxoheptanedioate aldolase
MEIGKNRLKAALASGDTQIGMWLGFASPMMAELVAGCGFDWCLIDGEHAPNTVQTILAQLQAMNGSAATPVVRVPVGEDWLLKQVLDIGVQTVMVPMVETAQDAEAMARAVRYPPDGVRGMAHSMIRASGYNAIGDYPASANGEICLIVQVESAKAIENIDEIAAVHGVDVVFIGPSDLSADMGYPGDAGAPAVVAAIEHAVSRIHAAGKASGIVTYGGDSYGYYHRLGVSFLGLGADVFVMAQRMRDLVAQTRRELDL